MIIRRVWRFSIYYIRMKFENVSGMMVGSRMDMGELEGYPYSERGWGIGGNRPRRQKYVEYVETVGLPEGSVVGRVSGSEPRLKSLFVSRTHLEIKIRLS